MTVTLNLSGTPSTKAQQDDGWNDASAALSQFITDFAFFDYAPDQESIQQRATAICTAIVRYDVNQTPDAIGAAFPDAVRLPQLDEHLHAALVPLLIEQGVAII